ncbi:hypothetical protein ASG56_16560 [Rhodococcus sp. Leaf7]|uniref:GGDEF domain-containing protein n=1 Tax=unclassified Rhodococcus (in: high G+C Gram-positive bacteria) TaxID=192944 RepID=UPI0007016087|nr:MULTISPECIES: GGDEF domain-containing protein [unclassified Rhodococcus (in: high G+C Gram-positive bacteria)]KQU02562.1 hypothetical protein ASG56_16560 [Rhodococcus sp. Leaf7]KQU38033.1 hypothetical protein ASG64_19290 [Rhodococcus sp. Leaf247]
MRSIGVRSWSDRAHHSREVWRSTAHDGDPVRSDLVIVQGLATISALCTVLFGTVFVWMVSAGDYDFTWWSKTYTFGVAAVSAATWCALHTARAGLFYRHTDTVTLVSAIMIVASPVLGYASAGSAYPAFGLVLAIVAFAGVLQRRTHIVVFTTAAVSAWIALAVAHGTDVSVETFAVSIVRTVLVVAVIHFFRMKTIDLLSEKYRLVEQARAAADSLSHVDELTGLLNRRGLTRRAAVDLDSCREHALPVSVLYLDVDGLKEMNDLSGHDAGDAALVRLADALTESFRGQDIIARVGGDEFVVVLPGADRADAVDLGTVAQAESSTAAVSVSIGVAVWTPGPDPPDLGLLIRRADNAMYREKARR